MALRFCTASFPKVIEINEDGSFRGYAAPMFNEFRSSLLRVFSNVTGVTTDRLGSMLTDSEKLDGCLGQLQKNESDITFPNMEFPAISPGIRQASVMRATKIVILSGYNTTAVFGLHADVMDAFHAFSLQLWSLSAATAFVLTLIIFMMFQCKPLSTTCGPLTQSNSRQRRHSMHRAAIVAMGNFLKQHSSYSCTYSCMALKLVVFWFAVFSCLLMFYFSSMIKTEMVVQKEPVTITCYDDVLSKRVRPLWIQQTDDSVAFQQAAQGTKECRIWQWARKIGIGDCVIKSDDDIQNVISKIMQQKSVWLTSSYLANIFLKNFCPVIRSKDNPFMFLDSNPLMTPDPSTQEILMGLLFSAHMNADKAKRYFRLTQTYLEFGFSMKVITMLEFVIAPYTGSRNELDCLANRIVFLDPPELDPVRISHYNHLIIVCGSLLLLLLLILSIERSASYAFQI